MFSSLDRDPEEAREQELGGLHGAVQGEVPQREERLRPGPLLSREQLFLRGQDDHPQSQAEQRLGVALGLCRPELTPPRPPTRSHCRSQGDLWNCPIPRPRPPSPPQDAPRRPVFFCVTPAGGGVYGGQSGSGSPRGSDGEHCNVYSLYCLLLKWIFEAMRRSYSFRTGWISESWWSQNPPPL